MGLQIPMGNMVTGKNWLNLVNRHPTDQERVIKAKQILEKTPSTRRYTKDITEKIQKVRVWRTQIQRFLDPYTTGWNAGCANSL
jgi:hypothetical protein